MEQAPAQECPPTDESTTAAPQRHTLQHTGPSYALPVQGAPYGHGPWHILLSRYQQQSQALNSMMPFWPQHTHTSMPQMFPQQQITAPPWDPRDFQVSRTELLLSKSWDVIGIQLNLMRAEVQRLSADNAVLMARKRMAEQTSDELRKELELLMKQVNARSTQLESRKIGPLGPYCNAQETQRRAAKVHGRAECEALRFEGDTQEGKHQAGCKHRNFGEK